MVPVVVHRLYYNSTFVTLGLEETLLAALAARNRRLGTLLAFAVLPHGTTARRLEELHALRAALRKGTNTTGGWSSSDPGVWPLVEALDGSHISLANSAANGADGVTGVRVCA